MGRLTRTKYHMIKQTHSHNAPWTIIRSKDKHKARMEAIKVILNAVNYVQRDETINYALDPEVVVSGAREIEIMDAQMTSSGKFMG